MSTHNTPSLLSPSSSSSPPPLRPSFCRWWGLRKLLWRLLSSRSLLPCASTPLWRNPSEEPLPSTSAFPVPVPPVPSGPFTAFADEITERIYRDERVHSYAKNVETQKKIKKNGSFTLRAFWWTPGLERLYTALSDLMLSPAILMHFFLFLKENKKIQRPVRVCKAISPLP